MRRILLKKSRHLGFNNIPAIADIIKIERWDLWLQMTLYQLLKILKIERLKNSPRNVISGIRYLRCALNPSWVALLSMRTPLVFKGIMYIATRDIVRIEG